MRKNALINYIVVCLAVLFIASCTSTRLVSTCNPDRIGQCASEKLLVAFMPDETADRDMVEKAMARALKQKNIEADPCAAVMPELKNCSKDSLISEANEQGIDFVMIMELAEVGVKDTLVEEYNPILTGYAWNGNTYNEIMKYQKIIRVKEKHIELESSLYDTGTGEKIWYGVSDTVKPDSEIAFEDILPSVTSTLSEELILLSESSF